MIPWRVAEDHREGYAPSVKWVRASGPSMGRRAGYMIFYICIAFYRALQDSVYCGVKPGDAIGTGAAYLQYYWEHSSAGLSSLKTQTTPRRAQERGPGSTGGRRPEYFQFILEIVVVVLFSSCLFCHTCPVCLGFLSVSTGLPS